MYFINLEIRKSFGILKYLMSFRDFRDDADSPLTKCSKGNVPKKSIINHVVTYFLLAVKYNSSKVHRKRKKEPLAMPNAIFFVKRWMLKMHNLLHNLFWVHNNGSMVYISSPKVKQYVHGKP